jgi:predicted HTH domain antitoxin
MKERCRSQSRTKSSRRLTFSEPEVKQELALALFQQERLTLAQASRLAEMTHLTFQALLAERKIPLHYGVQEFREDLRTIRQTDRL